MCEEQIIALVEQINGQNSEAVEEMTASLLRDILSNNIYLTVLYKLIFHTYRHSTPELACALLKGFIRFGQSKHMQSKHKQSKHKPLIDYLVIEAYNGLFKMGGWSLLKPCVIMLKNNKEERLYQYILDSVVNQLKQDDEKGFFSDLCFHLPREKSFSWGWFSYEVATNGNTDLTEKQLRKCMMIYRKLLTYLRQNYDKTSLPSAEAYVSQAYVSQAYVSPAYVSPLSWPTLLNILDTPEYQWVSDIINANEVEANEVEANEVEANEVEANDGEFEIEEVFKNEVFENEVECEIVEDASANVVEANVVEANVVEANILANKEANVLANKEANVVAAPEKKSWLYSLFGWS